MPDYLNNLRNRFKKGYTLVELMVAVSVFAAGSGLIYQLLVANVGLAAKNTSLNNSNGGIQQSYLKLLTGLEGALSFVDCANYNQTTKTFTAVATGTWANSVRFMRPLLPEIYILPGDGSGFTPDNPPPPTRGTYYSANASPIYFTYNTNIYSAAGLPSNIRLFLSFPKVTETVTTGASPGVKPGLGIASLDFSALVKPGDTGTMRMTNAIGANVIHDCNHAYLMIESAFVVTTDPRGSKTLIYMSDTNKPSEYVIVCPILDSANQTQTGDGTIPAGGTSGTFCLAASGDAIQTLLPIRDREANNFLARDTGDAKGNNGWININSKFHQRQGL